MPNFKKLAKPYYENALKALQELVRCPSVYDPTTIEANAPYGRGVKKALDYVAKLGKDYGFRVDTCDGHCTELAFGQGDGPDIGIYAHSDVVPVSGSWRKPPFSGAIEGEGKEAKLISRGSSDDKGPLIAALFACKLLKDNNLIQGYKIRFVTGGDEERGSSCLDYYFHKLKKPATDYGFTPDADFPLIYAEKGIVHGTLSKTIDLKPVIAMDGGTVPNAVCDKLVITLPADKKFAQYLKDKNVPSEVNNAGEIDIVTFKGKTAHGSRPDLGINAALIGFQALAEFYKIAALDKLVGLLSDPSGKAFGGDGSSKELGANTWNFGVVKYGSDQKLSITVDFRFGEGMEPHELMSRLEKATEMSLSKRTEAPVLLYDKKSPLVSTLMKSYKRMTHKFFDKPMAIGGGTYAKEAKNCVAYGSAFKNHPGDIHSPNEYIYLDDFYAQIAIYADAIYSLGQLKK